VSTAAGPSLAPAFADHLTTVGELWLPRLSMMTIVARFWHFDELLFDIRRGSFAVDRSSNTQAQ